MRQIVAMVAALVLAAMVIICSGVSLLLSWAAWPFDILKAACLVRAQRIAHSVRNTAQ
jgi:hypothetical protein